MPAAAAPPPRRALVAFGALSCAYFAYSGLFVTYAPLWFQSLGLGTLSIGALASLQSATRLFSPYGWGWVADHTGQRTRLLRLAVALALASSLGYFAARSFGTLAAVTAALFVCTAGVIPISEAALAHFVSSGAVLDAGRYGRVRVWGSLGYIGAVIGSGALLQALGVGLFPWLLVALLGLLLAAALRLPVTGEIETAAAPSPGALAQLRRPLLAWFFAGVFFTVLAHTGLYAFLSLYLVALGYSKSEVGVLWAIGVVVEVGWFWFQGRWLARRSAHAWLTLAALVSVLRFALTAGWAALPWLLVLAQCTHAITFAAQHSSCIGVINRHFPGRLRGRGQALYTVLGYGASGLVGGIAGGALSQAWGYPAVFWGASAAAAAGALCAGRAWMLERRATDAAR